MITCNTIIAKIPKIFPTKYLKGEILESKTSITLLVFSDAIFSYVIVGHETIIMSIMKTINMMENIIHSFKYCSFFHGSVLIANI